MKDKTIFRTNYDQPLHKGKVVQYNELAKTGLILSEQGEELFFNYSLHEPQLGDQVSFNKYPSVRIPNKYYAKNISKGYLSQDGFLVIDHVRSHVHESVKPNLTKIIGRISCSNRGYIYDGVRFPTIIGLSACVPISWEDEIVYAVRLGRERYSKFVKRRDLLPTHYVSIFLKQKQEIYIIRSCYYGEYVADSDLYDFNDERESFWNDHALVFDSEPIDETTVTSICPWTGVNENNRFGNLFNKSA